MSDQPLVNDILITNATVLTLDPDRPGPINDGYLLVRDTIIQALGPMAELPATIRARQTIAGNNCLVIPGLVNCHTHAAMTLFRGLADDLELMTWLNQHIFPAEAKSVTQDMVYWCSKLAALEMIRAGITCIADGYFHEDQAVRAFRDTGLRAVAAQGVIDFPAPGVPDPAENVATAARFIDTWQGKDPLITPAIFCHSPYTCAGETIKKAKAAARAGKAPFFIHLAETRAEADRLRAEHGVSPLNYLAGLGVLDRDTVCVHCVWLEPEDLAILTKSRAGVSVCTTSNMKLAAGIAPLPEMLDLGIPVGLGTDGSASNNTLDLFREMDRTAKLHKVSKKNPTLLPAGQLLAMASSGGARVLGLGERIGSLAPGKQADLVMIDLSRPHLTPFYHPDLLVYGAGGGDVHTVIINGRVVLANRAFRNVDQEETMEQVRRLARRLTRSA